MRPDVATADAANRLRLTASVTVSSQTAAQALALQHGQRVWLDGFATPNDGGHGMFYYDATSTIAADGGTVLTPNSGVGRLLREFSGALNVRWFGAKGN